jgi:hypothetical protein
MWSHLVSILDMLIPTNYDQYTMVNKVSSRKTVKDDHNQFSM